jgi:poly(3-hydroxybutyrate) depolymerase
MSLANFFRGKINDEFARNSGYNEVGEANNIIILYPQATVSYVPNNPNGCWDWWGYTNNKYGKYVALSDEMLL